MGPLPRLSLGLLLSLMGCGLAEIPEDQDEPLAPEPAFQATSRPPRRGSMPVVLGGGEYVGAASSSTPRSESSRRADALRHKTAADAAAAGFQTPKANQGNAQGKYLRDAARDLRLPNGKRLGEMKGSVVVLDFWRAGCWPCVAAMPHLNALDERFKGGAYFVGVGAFDTQKSLPAKVEKMKTDPRWEESPYPAIEANPPIYSMLYAEDLKKQKIDPLKLMNTFGIKHFPVLVVIDPEGREVHREEGFPYKKNEEQQRRDVTRRIEKAILGALGET